MVMSALNRRVRIGRNEFAIKFIGRGRSQWRWYETVNFALADLREMKRSGYLDVNANRAMIYAMKRHGYPGVWHYRSQNK